MILKIAPIKEMKKWVIFGSLIQPRWIDGQIVDVINN